jgi:hypothetical protein
VYHACQGIAALSRPQGDRGPASRWSSPSKLEKRQDADIEVVVYARLLDEGADVWRPVLAKALPDGTFRAPGNKAAVLRVSQPMSTE